MTNQQNCQEYSSNTSINCSGNCSNSHPTLTQTAKFNSYKAPCNQLPQLFPVVKNGTLCAHINIHSLVSKINEIKHHVLSSNMKVLSINQTLFDTTISNCELNIPGFSLFRCDRHQKGGGVALYISDLLSPTLLHINRLHNHVEAVSATIHIGNTPFIITSLYRQPTSKEISFSELNEIIEQSLSHKLNYIFLGDLNIDFMATFNNRGHDIELTYQLKQLIKDNTRVTNTSKTTIDLIYTNVPHYHSKYVTPLCISDHYMTFTILDLKIPKSNCKSTIVRCRNYNKFDGYLFQQDILNSVVFNTIYNSVDLN